MSEFIVVQVGQCGNQIGNCFWKYVIQEYGIEMPCNSRQKNTPKILRNPDVCESFNSFFWNPQAISGKHLCTLGELEKAKIKARAVCIDMEDSVVARFRKGPLSCLFNDACLLTNYPGSGNNWAEGFFTHGNKYYDTISDMIRKAVEHCDGLNGFLLLHSLGGGTGSGLGSRVLSLLEDQFPHIDRLVTSVYPAGSEDVITAPYNVALATSELLKGASCVFPVNNEALVDMCGRAKLSDPKDKNNRFFRDLNNVIVNMLLHLTSGARFPGPLNVDINEIATNMVPYPGMHFISSSVSPLSTASMKAPPAGSATGVDNILSGTWNRTNQLIKVDPCGGIILAAALNARGDISICDLRRNIEKLKKKGKFVSWNQDAVKTGLCAIPPHGHKSSALGLFNSSSLSTLFEETSTQFSKLFKRRAHTHHYMKVDGFEMSNFFESLEQLQDIAAAYKELETHRAIIPPRFEVV